MEPERASLKSTCFRQFARRVTRSGDRGAPRPRRGARLGSIRLVAPKTVALGAGPNVAQFRGLKCPLRLRDDGHDLRRRDLPAIYLSLVVLFVGLVDSARTPWTA